MHAPPHSGGSCPAQPAPGSIAAPAAWQTASKRINAISCTGKQLDSPQRLHPRTPTRWRKLPSSACSWAALLHKLHGTQPASQAEGCPSNSSTLLRLRPFRASALKPCTHAPPHGGASCPALPAPGQHRCSCCPATPAGPPSPSPAPLPRTCQPAWHKYSAIWPTCLEQGVVYGAMLISCSTCRPAWNEYSTVHAAQWLGSRCQTVPQDHETGPVAGRTACMHDSILDMLQSLTSCCSRPPRC